VHTHIGAYHILHGVDFEVPAGQVTMLLGRNGAGKTTTLRTIMGLWSASQGRIEFDGRRIGGPAEPGRKGRRAAHARDRPARHRLRAENMGIFADLTVRENMLLAARQAKNAPSSTRPGSNGCSPSSRRCRKFWLYPAGKLSGGQKQMLAIARAMVEPRRLLLIDEPSKGLAPAIVQNLIAALRELKSTATTVLLVEQNFAMAKALGDTVAVMDDGRVVHRGEMAALAEDDGPAAQAARPVARHPPVRTRR
jgi:branched-chain amino acid transport system ATP-binding protein